jgi:hypothetical protein
MNIFVSSPDPEISAAVLDNKRVVKMVLETCQLLSTAINESGGIGPYKSTHINHPCSIWARSSRENYRWLFLHFIALIKEYRKRYKKIHKCQTYISELYSGGNTYIKPGKLTEFVNCTVFKDKLNVHEAYCNYLDLKWKTDNRTPVWG